MPLVGAASYVEVHGLLVDLAHIAGQDTVQDVRVTCA